MGEAKAKQSATAKFIAQHPLCCFCGATRAATTREHMPPRSLFDNSHRPDKLVMPACQECNHGTSTADLVAAIVSRWNYNSGAVEIADHRKLIGRVRRHHSEIYSEWTEPVDRDRARRHLTEYGVDVPLDAGLVLIGPKTVRQLNLFAHKVALALHFERFRTPLTDDGAVSALWRSKEDFAQGAPPELLGMMRQYGTLEQGKWNTSETFEYRFEENRDEGLLISLARFRGGLYVGGFVAKDATQLPPEDVSWIKPSTLLSKLDNPEFEKKQ